MKSPLILSKYLVDLKHDTVRNSQTVLQKYFSEIPTMIKKKNIYTSCLYVPNTMISSNYIYPLPPSKEYFKHLSCLSALFETHLVPWVSKPHKLLTDFYQILSRKHRTHRGVSCFLLKFILHRVEAASLLFYCCICFRVENLQHI